MNKLNSNWITGFVDVKGCFYVGVTENKLYSTGWIIKLNFIIKLHKRDKELLKKIKFFFKEAGTIKIIGNFVYYNVCNKTQLLNIIIPHFEKYPLITKKRNDFLIFKNIMNIIYKNEHVTKTGLKRIINLKALSKDLKNDFSEIDIPKNINYYWFSGFFSGEGYFFIDIFKSKTVKVGYCIRLHIIIRQHFRDKLLINNFKNIFESGSIHTYKNMNYISYDISKFKDIITKVIPFFYKYKIEGEKFLDFQDFCKVANLMTKKSHLSLEGLNKIKKIKYKMNKTRYILY